MAAIIEVKYFNSFLLKKTINYNSSSSSGTKLPVWNGSRGMQKTGSNPLTIGVYPVIDNLDSTNNWLIEESRIRGGYNNTIVDLGPRAFLVEEELNGIQRINSLIYSGIFNSRTGINQTNVFPVGDDISKSLDPSQGSIQRLFAENTNLTIFQENKVSYSLIDKDAIYTAEGGGVQVSQLNLVLGQIVPYLGNFGIGKNPESFATYGFRKYFVDPDRGAVLRLSRDGITEISNYGMYDFFRDELSNVNTNTSSGNMPGGWDIHNKQYVVSLQNTADSKFSTLSFDESVRGWTSFFTYKPEFMVSLRNDFYSFNNGILYQHYSDSVNRGNFYGVNNNTSITFIFNPNVSMSKNFKTINYEGSNGWRIDSIESDQTGLDNYNGVYSNVTDLTASIPSYLGGEYILNPVTNEVVYPAQYGTVFGNDNPPYNRSYAGFVRKENKYVANLINATPSTQGEVIFGNQMSGIKGYFTTVTISTDDATAVGEIKELFAVSSEYVQSAY